MRTNHVPHIMRLFNNGGGDDILSDSNFVVY